MNLTEIIKLIMTQLQYERRLSFAHSVLELV